MQIDNIGGLVQKLNPMKEVQGTNGAAFKNVITDFIGDVNTQQKESAAKTEEFIMGGNIEIHEVMIAGEKAKTSLDLLVEIRNKAVDMYKELTRIQI